MFHPLPAETVFESQRQCRRETFFLFAVLLIFYVVSFTLLFLLSVFLFVPEFASFLKENYNSLILVSCGASVAAYIHFFRSKNKHTKTLLEQLGALPADSKDAYHKIFINLVQEAEAATAIRPIHAVVIPSTGSNAFALMDSYAMSVIGVTEGLLSKLDRSELSAVVAHEASHLINGDSKLITIVSSLIEVFNRMVALMKKSSMFSRTRNSPVELLARLLMIVCAACGRLIATILFMSISRQREYLADSCAVHMCKDPLSLAEALYKISGSYRGYVNPPVGYSGIFIMNPFMSKLDEESGFWADLFTTHPPVSKRLEKLLGWAKTDAIKLGSNRESKTSPREEKKISAGETPQLFYAKRESNWAGPYTLEQMAALEFIMPATWIFSADSQEPLRAADHPLILDLFLKRTSGTAEKSKCPRCKVRLSEKMYENAPVLQCSFCGGYLLRRGVTERIVSRREAEFSKDEIKKAQEWRQLQTKPLYALCQFPNIKCPVCETQTAKCFHSSLTSVVIDRCTNPDCQSVWCDTGELEKIQMLVEDASSSR